MLSKGLAVAEVRRGEGASPPRLRPITLAFGPLVRPRTSLPDPLTSLFPPPIRNKVAHVHVRHAADIPLVRRVLENTPGVEMVMDSPEVDAYYRDRGKLGGGGGRRASSGRGAHHPQRSGELVAVSDSRSWFAYYYWEDDTQAPDFARCVAIHRKPGYDPAEMFFRFPGFAGFAWLMLKLLLAYGLKLRTNVDATPLRCDMIRGSHGRLPGTKNAGGGADGDDPRPLLMFRSSSTAGRPGAVGVDPLAIDDGKVEELGRQACLAKGGLVVAEDVYEVLWRILNRDI